MNWPRARLAIVYLYAIAFLSFGLLLIYAAYFGSRPWRFSLYFYSSLPFVAEAIGLFFFLWLARVALKLALALVIWFFLSGGFEHGFSTPILVFLGFSALLLFGEIRFIGVDRKIAEERRSARSI